MQFLQIENEGAVRVIKMARGKANAMNPPMVEEMNAAVAEAAADDAVRAIVLASATSRFFSSGFDFTEVFPFDRPTMAAFFGRFIDLYEALANAPKPVLAAMSGHAFAGGAVVAVACDIRVMGDGPFSFALNEVNLGVALPVGIIRMTEAAVGLRHARHLLLEGASIPFPDAAKLGLADEVCETDIVLEHTLRRAHSMAQKPPQAFAAIKRQLVRAGSDRDGLEPFLDSWFSAESVAKRQEAAASLQRKA